MKILFSGGGTLGPVTPLLGIHEIALRAHPELQSVWVGTSRGPERALVEAQGIRFVTITSGKFRRYLSPWNITDIGRIIFGFFQSIVLLWKENPDACVSAGGFISVPIHWAAWFMGIPTWIHEQDVDPGLAIRLMSPTARVITVALEKNVQKFSKKKTQWLGNPVRQAILSGSKTKAMRQFGLDPALPVVFALGGGTGSIRINALVAEAVQHLSGVCSIIHLTGKERAQQLVERAAELFPFYHVFSFFTDEMKDAYAAADVVVARGGFGTLTELAALGKAAIIIPKGGHQETNVGLLVQHEAVVTMSDLTATGYELAQRLKSFLSSGDTRRRMGDTLQAVLPRASETSVLDIIELLVSSYRR